MAQYKSPDDVTLKDVLEYLGVAATHTDDGFALHDGGDTMPSGEKIVETKKELFERDHGIFYKTQRSKEYPSIQEQLDDLFHNKLFSKEMTARIQAVKDKYPKS